MWPFTKNKDKDSAKNLALLPTSSPKQAGTEDLGKTDAQRALLTQMRGLRAEIGEETLQKLAKKLQFEDLKNKIRHDIENDEDKRNRLLDEIRGELRGE